MTVCNFVKVISLLPPEVLPLMMPPAEASPEVAWEDTQERYGGICQLTVRNMCEICFQIEKFNSTLVLTACINILFKASN